MPSTILSMSIDKTQNIPIIVGNTATFNISIKNISSNQRLYNLGLYLTLPDGLIISSSSITQTSSITNVDNSITYSWINLKDLAPFEINYTFSITVKCNTKFKNSATIPFGYIFTGINISCQVDTMPRGNFDIGNEVITQLISMSFQTTRFYSSVSTSEKVLKGAGTSASLNDYTQVNIATCKFYNNSVSSSLVNITILLDDGIRYIGNVSSYGTDASQFINPTISLVSINNKLYTQVYYGNINLSISSNTTITFSYAVWNQYNNNQGDFIIHGTKLNMYINMNSSVPLIVSRSDSITSFTAMDLIITTTTKSVVDVQNTVTYTYVYKVGQYYNIQNILVHYFLPDGIFYISSSYTPTSIVDNPISQGYYITYNFSLATQNSVKTVTVNAKVDSYYRYKKDSQSLNLPVVASDPFLATTDILGTLVGSSTQVTDSSSVSSSIGIGSISKQFIKGYYKDGTIKTINTLAPGDFVEYTLTYNASTLKAIQKQVYIDDFFPLSTDPINNLTCIYTGYNPISQPLLINPHGIDFYYGDIPGLSSASINFKVSIALLGNPNQNINLMKLKGVNTYGYAYSNRSQVTVNIGTPNLQLTKSVTGPNKSAIQSNEIYSYTLILTNTNTLGTETDAFNFTLSDTLSIWFTLNQNSLTVTGSGDYNIPQVQNNNIILYVNKLSPGQSLTLTYKVTISPTMAPGVSITTTATNTNPYSQVYNASLNNFQYTNLNKNTSVTLYSLAIALTKTNISSIFKVGSLITYKITVIIPKGTIAYGLYVKDTLPSSSQIYIGPTYKNGILITPIISSNIVILPSEETIDARLSTQTIIYSITCKIANSTKNVGATTSTQNNTVQCLYQQIKNGTFSTISKTLTITINHPNLLMSLSTTDKTTAIIYNQTANINTTSVMQFKLIFQNNSSVMLINGTIEIPIDDNFLFSSVDTTILCSAIYQSSSKKIIVNVAQLDSSLSGYITFTLIPKSNLRSGSSINTQSTAISYYNDISPSKIYSGEKSNMLTCVLPPGVSLVPNPLNQINNSTSFIVTTPGNTCVIINYFKNTGGGYDDFTLIIQKVALPYNLYIDNTKIADFPANTVYQSNLPIMANLAPNTTKEIKIMAVIPITQSIGVRHDFTVTTKSKTSPYPESTVLNIDPS